jgi:hypothetical protein
MVPNELVKTCLRLNPGRTQMNAISRVFFELDVNYGSLHFRCESPCVRLDPRSEMGQFDSRDGIGPNVCR